jgi:hypothetical protein
MKVLHVYIPFIYTFYILLTYITSENIYNPTTKQLSLSIHEASLNIYKTIPFLTLIEVEPVKINQYNMPAITMSLGTPPQTFEFLLTTFSSKLYISEHDDGFNCNASSTCIDQQTIINLAFISSTSKGKLLKDTLHLGTTQLPNFNFIQIIDDTVEYIYKGMIGFDYLSKGSDRDIKNTLDYSLLSQLYIKGIINEQIFSIGKVDNETKIIFGGTPGKPKDINNKTYKTCDLIQRQEDGNVNSLWKCKLNAVYFDDGKFIQMDDTEEIAFGITNAFSSVSKSFFDFLIETYFQNAIDRGICNINNDGASQTVWCMPEFGDKQIEDIHFVIGKWSLRIPKEKLWIKRGKFNERIFCLMYYPQKKYTWSINYHLIENEYALVFDRANDKFGLLKYT